MKNKKKTFGIVLLVIVLMCGAFVGGYFVNEKGLFNIKKESTKEVKKENDKEQVKTKLKEDEMKKIMSVISTFEESTYDTDKLEADSISSESKIKYAIGYELLLKDNIEKTNTPSTQDDMGNQYSIKWKVVSDRVKEMFGSKTRLEYVSNLAVTQAGAGCFTVNGSSESNPYMLDPFGCDVGWRFDHYEKKYVDGIKYEDKAEINVKILHLECDPETNECSIENLDDNELGKVKKNKNDMYDLDSYYDKATTIKYTFNLENDNYYFVSSEFVK